MPGGGFEAWSLPLGATNLVLTLLVTTIKVNFGLYLADIPLKHSLNWGASNSKTCCSCPSPTPSRYTKIRSGRVLFSSLYLLKAAEQDHRRRHFSLILVYSQLSDWLCTNLSCIQQGLFPVLVQEIGIHIDKSTYSCVCASLAIQ